MEFDGEHVNVTIGHSVVVGTRSGAQGKHIASVSAVIQFSKHSYKSSTDQRIVQQHTQEGAAIQTKQRQVFIWENGRPFPRAEAEDVITVLTGDDAGKKYLVLFVRYYDDEMQIDAENFS